jgi:ADP-heptose:LPS heptosyltransferase
MKRRSSLVFSGLLKVLPRPRRAPSAMPSTFERILVVRQHNQLGDMLCAVPLLRALRARFPAAEITLLTSPVNRDAMLGLEHVNEIVDYDKRRYIGASESNPTRLLRFVGALRRKRFDLAIVPCTVSLSSTSDVLAYCCGAPVRIGAASLEGRINPRVRLFTHAIELDWRNDPHRHQTLRNLDLAAPLGATTPDLSHQMTLDPREAGEGRAWIERHAPEAGARIGFHPGAGKVANRWPAESFAEVANQLGAETGARAVITCGPMDEEPVRAMLARLEVPHAVVRGEPIRRVAAILARLDLVITNDTGIMHVAAAVGTPVLSLFGPTDAAQWAPLGPSSRALAASDGRIESIRADEVLRAARELFAASRARGSAPASEARDAARPERKTARA